MLFVINMIHDFIYTPLKHTKRLRFNGLTCIAPFKVQALLDGGLDFFALRKRPPEFHDCPWIDLRLGERQTARLQRPYNIRTSSFVYSSE